MLSLVSLSQNHSRFQVAPVTDSGFSSAIKYSQATNPIPPKNISSKTLRIIKAAPFLINTNELPEILFDAALTGG